jgi:3-phenylpropionate/cinnamic acid dioxygenase small subunit
VTDEEAIRNHISRYFQLLDDRDYEGWAALLTPDARVTINDVDAWPPDVQVPGQRGQHVSVNPIVKVDGDTATAVFDYFYFAQIGPPGFQRQEIFNFGRYHDRLVRTDDGWRLTEVAMKVVKTDHLGR